MKKLTFIWSLIIFSCATSKVQFTEVIDQSYKSKEPGKCYFALKNNNKEEWNQRSAMLIETVDPVYSPKIIAFEVSELIKNNPNKKVVSFKVREAHVKYEIRNELITGLHYERDTGYSYCLMELPSLYKSILLDTINAKYIELEFTEIIIPAKIKYIEVEKRPRTLTSNQLYFNSGKWSKERVLDYGSHCPPNLYLNLQRALNKRGYELEETNKFDEATRQALIDFQTQNDLQVGNLNFETMKLLEIK